MKVDLCMLGFAAAMAVAGMARSAEGSAGGPISIGPPAADVVHTNAAYGPLVGDAVALWARTAVVGSVGEGTATTWIRGDDGVFYAEATLEPTVPAPAFGGAVGVWGDTVIVGAPGGAGAAIPGEALVFVRTESGWSEQAVLSAADGTDGDAFGTAVAISGDTAIVGAPDVDGGAPGAGAAYVFTRAGGIWTEQAKLTVVNAQQGAALGASVAAWGNTVVVGAPYGDGQVPASGVAYVFTRGAGGWTARAKLAAADGDTGDQFGAAVGLREDTAVVGAPGCGYAGDATLFVRAGDSWSDAGPLGHIAAVSELGAAIAPWGGDVLVRGHDPSGETIYARAITVESTLADATCGSATTLGSLATCIRDQMPRSGSNGFVPPTPAEQADFQTVVGAMLGGACDFALPASLSGVMRIRTFADTDNGKSYCLLMEIADNDGNGVVDMGWGTFIVDPQARRDLSMNAPHPVADSTTEVEAIEIFKGTDARSYLMCGAHRNANSAASACQPASKEADCAHATATMYYAAVQEIDAFYGSAGHTVMEWHGMAGTTCENIDVYVSPGLASTPLPGSYALALQANVTIYNPAWNVTVPGSGTCSQNGTTNVAGRFLNGVVEADICTTDAVDETGRFLHIEQHLAYRVPSSWIPAVEDTWPVLGPPNAPATLSAVAGDTEVSLIWSTVSGADEYRVWTSAASGGPYTNIASGLTVPAFTHTGLTNGVTYYYVVTAANAAGESPASPEASATPTGVPAAPTGLMATPGKKRVSLSWVGSPGATSYRVKRSLTSGGPYATIANVTSTSYNNNGLTSGVTYYYVTTAVNAAGESGPSNEASATPR